MSREELTPIRLKISPKIAEEEKLLHSLYETAVTLIPKPEVTMKEENDMPKSLINLDAKFFNKIQQTESNTTLNGAYTMIKWNLSQGRKDSSIYANQSMSYTILTKYEGKNMIFGVDAEKVSTKFNTYL